MTIVAMGSDHFFAEDPAIDEKTVALMKLMLAYLENDVTVGSGQCPRGEDQREVDFLKTRSEAIRQVKCAIEDEGMDMPEPIYRVRLTGAAGDSQAPGADNSAVPRARTPRSSEEVQPDVSVNHDLDVQVARERAAHEGQDLLQHSAPKE